MKLCAVCVTYDRPALLGRLIHCFRQQTDTQHRLFILDDAGQYETIVTPTWALVSTSTRYHTLGAKRNAAVQLAMAYWPGIEGIATADDDDVYWPHWLSSVSTALETARWAQARVVFEPAQAGVIKKVKTSARRVVDSTSFAYGATFAWRLSAFIEAGMYASRDIGEDQDLSSRCSKLYGLSGDSTKAGPWFLHNRRPGQMWELGENAYELRRKTKIPYVGYPNIGWNGDDMYKLKQMAGVYPRPF